MWLHDGEFSSHRYATSLSYTSIQMFLKYSLNPCLNGLDYVTLVHCPRNDMTVSTGQVGDHMSLLGAVALKVC